MEEEGRKRASERAGAFVYVSESAHIGRPSVRRTGRAGVSHQLPVCPLNVIHTHTHTHT
jgi:hypothetical protein